eukprot:g2790.t1
MNKALYTRGAIANAKLAPEIYGTSWTCRFYVADDVPKDIVNELETCPNTQVVVYKSLPGRAGQLVRFLPASESNVECLLVRDTDSRLNMREKVAVDEWIRSGKKYHVMYEHMHEDNTILGGMWGVRSDGGGVGRHSSEKEEEGTGAVATTTTTGKPTSVLPPVPDMDKMIFACLESGKRSDAYGDDMAFLDSVLLPRMTKANTMKHGGKQDGDGLPWTDTSYRGYVGQVMLCTCGVEEFLKGGCKHATRVIPCSVATRVHSSPKIMGLLSGYLTKPPPP